MEIVWNQILFQILNFGILMFLFTKFLLKPILKVLDTRAVRIKEGLESAEKNIKLQKDLEESKGASLKTARKEASKLITEAKKQSDEIIKQAKEAAKKEAKVALDKERTAFQAQMKKQAKDFEDSMNKTIALAVQAVLKGSLDQKLQNSIVDAQIKQVRKDLFN